MIEDEINETLSGTPKITAAALRSVLHLLHPRFVTPAMFRTTADTDDTASVQAAVDHVAARGGGEVLIPREHHISDTIHIGSNVHLRGTTQNAGLRQHTDNIPVLSASDVTGGKVSRWSVKRLRCSFANQQSAEQTGGIGLYLGGANTIVSQFAVEELDVQGAYQGVKLPNLTGCFGFLGRFVNCNFIQCADYGFSWVGASSGGASTNLSLQGVWTTNFAGQEIAGSKGFQISRTQGLSMDNCGCDHVQGQPFLLSSVRGRAGVLWAESCDLAASSGQLKFLELSGSRMHIDYVYAIANTIALTGSAECYLVYANSGSFISADIIEDNVNTLTDSSSGSYYTANVDGTSYVENASFHYLAAGASPAPNANLADNHSPSRIRRWDGVFR
jgi:hypothetical protein